MNQMQKTLATLGALVVAAAAVGLFAWKGVAEKDTRARDEKDRDERLFAAEGPGERSPDGGAAKAEFVKLIVTTQGQTTTLVREPGQAWRLVSPISARADVLVLDTLVSQLQTARFKTTLEGEATDAELKTYGLDAPSFVVEAEAVVEGAARKTRLEGGIENPFDGTIYMRRDGSRKVQLAEGGVRWSLAKTPFDLREKELLAVEEKSLKRFSVKTRINDWELERGEDRLWRLTRPEQTLADAVTVTSLLGSLRGEHATGFPEGTASALGFDTPEITARFVTDEGETTIKIVRPTGDAGGQLYALREDANGVVIGSFNPSVTSSFERNAMELRDRSVINFRRDAVTRAVFRNADGTEVIVEKESVDASAEAWQVVAPRRGPAKVYKLANTLWTLSATKSGPLIVDKPSEKELKDYSLDGKGRGIELFGADGQLLARLRIGKELTGKTATFAVLGTRQAIVELDGSRFNELPQRADDLLDLAAPPDAGR